MRFITKISQDAALHACTKCDTMQLVPNVNRVGYRSSGQRFMRTRRAWMKKDDGLSELVYEYYESRILFGHYRYGEQLLSVSQICSSFQVGRNTVLAALQKLEENGYIATEERKVARIAYQGTEEIFKKILRIISYPAETESWILLEAVSCCLCQCGRQGCKIWDWIHKNLPIRTQSNRTPYQRR